MPVWAPNWFTARKATGVASVTEGLQTVYRDTILPLEKDNLFHEIVAPPWDEAVLAAKPMVLLMGQYSTGKTTFIQNLLEREYPGSRVGPDATSDKVTIVTHSKAAGGGAGADHERVIPGNVLVSMESMPFQQFRDFGSGFLERFEAACLPVPVLEGVTFIDTPGILSGEKQRLHRGYDFEAVVKQLARQADMILLLFDASKLDISDEFHQCIRAVIGGSNRKIRIVLNKADDVAPEDLMRVHAALMFQLGRVLDAPEAPRVYLGSFWDKPHRHEEFVEMFKREERELKTDILRLPRDGAMHKVDEIIARARRVKAHVCLMSKIAQMYKRCWFTFTESNKRSLIDGLEGTYREAAREGGVSEGDFIDRGTMAKWLEEQDRSQFGALFKNVDRGKLGPLERATAEEVPRLISVVVSETQGPGAEGSAAGQQQQQQGGAAAPPAKRQRAEDG